MHGARNREGLGNPRGREEPRLDGGDQPGRLTGYGEVSSTHRIGER